MKPIYMGYTVFCHIPYIKSEVHKMKKISTFSIGFLTGIAITVSGVAGAATYLKATPKTVKIVVGSNQKSVEAMNVNNKLYVPVRDAGESFGYSVSGVTSSVVTFSEGAVDSSTTTGTSTGSTANKTGGQYVEGLHDKYSTDGKLDANKIKVGLAAGEITVNAQEKESGNSLMHYVVIENNYYAYVAIKTSKLNVNLQNNEGQTPLHLAVINKNSFYFGELQDLQANPNVKDKNGLLPIDYAGDSTVFVTGLKSYMTFYKE
ncbi:hypothetical protein D3C75_455390 [compost metagenome]